MAWIGLVGGRVLGVTKAFLFGEEPGERPTGGVVDRAQISRDALLELMRSSHAADKVARDGRWEDATMLLCGAAGRAFEGDASTMPPWGVLEPPEARYQRTRAWVAARVRASLGGVMEPRLASLRVFRRRAFIGLALIVAAVMAIPTWRRARDRDLTAGATWKASSAAMGLAEGTFSSPNICQTLPAYFFHTLQEPAPHLDIDLRSVREVDRVVVVNRYDCCYERARGLELLLSADGEHYVTAARRDAVSFFRRWEVTFQPTQARWVRLQLPAGIGTLHLSDVRIYGR